MRIKYVTTVTTHSVHKKHQMNMKLFETVKEISNRWWAAVGRGNYTATCNRAHGSGLKINGNTAVHYAREFNLRNFKRSLVELSN
jgi:hypothetical protein